MSYKKWYDSHKLEFAKKRRSRYEEDEEYRERQKIHARRYYWLNKRRAERVEDVSSMKTFVSNDKIQVKVTNEEDIRYGMYIGVPVYQPSDVAKLFGRSVQTVRLWFTKGILPEILYRSASGVRLYTQDQFSALANNAHLLTLPTKEFDKHPFFIAVKKEWDKLQPDGIQPMLKDGWRFDPVPCAWCGATPSLQKLDTDSNGTRWVNVPCFACKDPYDVDSRVESTKFVYVSGYCKFCEDQTEKEVQMTGDKMILQCDKCGRKINDFKIV